MRSLLAVLCFVFFSVFVPLVVYADAEVGELPVDAPAPPAEAPEVLFTLNGVEADADISSRSPFVSVSVVFSEEVYLTRLYLCAESADPCNQGNATKYFSPNATTTAYSTEWSGEIAGGGEALAGTYQIVAHFYHYDSAEEAQEEVSLYSIELLDETEAEEEVVTPLPPTVEFLVSGAEISSTTPPVEVTASSSAETYFESIYICSEDVDLCNPASAIKYFDIAATSTHTSVVWEGDTATNESAAPGVYQATLYYFAYEVSSDAVVLVASTTVVVHEDVSENEEEGEEEGTGGGGEASPPPVPFFTPVNSSNYPSNQNIGNKVWTKENSPYVVEDAVYIRYGSLTIEPGVVVKFADDATLTVHASAPLTARGTISDPIIFTSLKDDSALGDTNNDGDATTPAPGDWGYISFGGGSWNNDMSIEHLRVRYGGGVPVTYGSVYIGFITTSPALLLHFPWYNGSPGVGYVVENIEVSHSADVGLFLDVGRNNAVEISLSSFYDNAAYGVYKRVYYGSPNNSDQTGSVNLSENWWGNESGPYHETLNTTGTGNTIFGTKLSLDSWLASDPFEEKSERYECCSSVVFLPGFQGSILKSGSNTLWPPTLFDVDGDLEKLAFEDGEPVIDDVTVHGILDTFYTKPIYQGFTNFVNTLTSVDPDTGTSTIKTWEPFAYDWRYGPDDIVDMNDWVAEIEQLAEDSFTGKVTLVAHSYGGLVGKALIKQLTDEGKADLIESFVMVGTPQLGTPQAVAGLLHGDGAEIKKNVEVNFLSFYANFDVVLVTKKNARNLGLTLDGAHHLLPSVGYFNRVIDPVVVFNPGLPGSLVNKWYSSYAHDGIVTYSDLSDFLRAERVPRTQNPAILESSLLTKAYNWHEMYDTFSYPSDMDVIQIAGWGLPTIKGIEYLGDKKGTNNLLMTTEGDKTVVYPSAVASDLEKYFLNLGIYNIDPTLNNYNHVDLLSFPPAQEVLWSIITNKPVATSIFVTKEKPEVENIDDKLIVSAHSPVTLGVTDQFGNYTGITPGQDPEADILTITNDIPGSSYFTVGDAKYIVLPNDGEYEFVMGGTGEGEVTVLIETLSEGDSQATAATYNFTVTEFSEATLNIENGTSSEIALDQDGDGIVDESILSDEALEAKEQEQQDEQVDEPTPSPTTPTPIVGGGPLQQNNPVTTPQVGIVAGISTSTPVPEEDTFILEEKILPPVLDEPPAKVVIAEAVEPQSTKEDVSTETNQQASAVQSGWYDGFIGFIKNVFKKSANFLSSLF